MRAAPILALLTLVACRDPASEKKNDNAVPPTTKDASALAVDPPPPPLPKIPTGLPAPPASAVTAELVARGGTLFGDAQRWGGRSCATCHDPERAYTSETPLDVTAAGKTNLRHTPTLTNLAFARSFYWDGRATSIEAMLPGHARGQLGFELDDDAKAALAAYVRTRYQGDAPWDRYEAGDSAAVGPDAIRGAVVFNERAGCALCHPPPLYSDLRLHSSVVPAGAGPPDPATGWKTPSLRGVASTSPYFHAGTAKSLEEALMIELRRDQIVLSDAERADLLAFLQAL